MRFPQVLVYEGDGRLAALLRPLAERRRWSLREPRQPEQVLRLLRRSESAVLVLKLGRDLERELTLLDRVNWLAPGAATVVVGDGDHEALAALAWDLGAGYVHFPPQPRELLVEVVAGLLGQPDAAAAAAQ
jgi:DNA-binding response OmpR family regulator